MHNNKQNASKMAPQPVHVLITGAAGQIGYALAPMVARGIMLGASTPVVLHLLDIEPAATALEGVKMELLDAAFPLLHGAWATSSALVASRALSSVGSGAAGHHDRLTAVLCPLPPRHPLDHRCRRQHQR